VCSIVQQKEIEMFKRQTRFSSAVTRSVVLAVAGIMFLTIAAGASSAAGFGVVDSVKQFFGLNAQTDVKPARAVDRPESLLLTEDFAYTSGSGLTGKAVGPPIAASGPIPLRSLPRV
jgi:hypothetical protein